MCDCDAATLSREKWEAAYDDAMQMRDWQTCDYNSNHNREEGPQAGKTAQARKGES